MGWLVLGIHLGAQLLLWRLRKLKRITVRHVSGILYIGRVAGNLLLQGLLRMQEAHVNILLVCDSNLLLLLLKMFNLLL